MQDASVEDARRLVSLAARIVVLTGAGISTDSGIPDFRGPAGVWTRDPDAERMSTLECYLSDPELRIRSWRRYLETQSLAAHPNPGHLALVSLEERGALSLLVTQNTDGLHLAAGHDPAKVVEIHGSGTRTRCVSCDHTLATAEVAARVHAGEADPRCRELSGEVPCGGILKRTTILFGESLVAEDLERSLSAARSCDLLLAVGSTLSVWPAAGLVPTAATAGATIVIVNGDPTDQDRLADVIVRGPISEILPAVTSPAGKLPPTRPR